MKHVVLLCRLLALFFGAADALGGVVNIDFNLGATPTYSGPGAAPDAAGNVVWNGLSLTGASAPGTANVTSTFSNLVFSDSSASGLSLTIRRTGQSDIPGGAQSGGNTAADLLRDYAVVNSGNTGTRLTGTITIAGLPAGSHHDLYLYGAGSQTDYRTEFTVSGTVLRTAGPTAATSALTEWEDFVRFTDIVPNQSNEIVIVFANVIDGPNPAQIGPVNGLQLVFAVPSPRPTLLIDRAGAGAVRLSWPTNASGFTLEQSAALSGTNWMALTNSAQVYLSEFFVLLETVETNRYFRLRKP